MSPESPSEMSQPKRKSGLLVPIAGGTTGVALIICAILGAINDIRNPKESKPFIVGKTSAKAPLDPAPIDPAPSTTSLDQDSVALDTIIAKQDVVSGIESLQFNNDGNNNQSADIDADAGFSDGPVLSEAEIDKVGSLLEGLPLDGNFTPEDIRKLREAEKIMKKGRE